jgi:sec-independent protein translocase protein TatB
VIKPKDYPKALRTVGYWVRHARQIAAEFQSSLEQMAREAELQEVKKEIEDAAHKLTSDVRSNFDPVELEKAINEPAATPAEPMITPPAEPLEGATAAPTDEPATGEPPTAAPASPEPATSEVAADEPAPEPTDPVLPKPVTHDRG